ncbi:hypothetical protein [Christiangramia echinicola]|uniref:hypothetical protein n=1 Tax=Christiangramia echinicola TaxID=279359 RepID=UPI00041114D3|nr:hypothetical protein [Christiangramia echinicola]
MNFKKLGADIYIPTKDSNSLKNIHNIKFNYYLSSRMNGNLIDLDITSKIFNVDKIYVRKSCYRIKIGKLEDCVKSNIIDHMKQLGMDESNIPQSLLNTRIAKRKDRLFNSTI